MTTPLAWPSPLLIHPGLFISHALCPRQTAAGSSQVFLPFVLSSPIHPPYSARLTVRKHKTDCYSPTSNPSVVPAVLGTKPKLLGRHTRLLLNWPPPACSDSSWDRHSPHSGCPHHGQCSPPATLSGLHACAASFPWNILFLPPP